jgi:hypothetical protein
MEQNNGTDVGHRDLSFARPEGWQQVVLGGRQTAATMLFVGDQASGPMVSLSRTSGAPEEAYSATHHHGTDQLRVVVRGSTKAVSRHEMHAGQFSVTEAGVDYREGVGGPDEVWLLLAPGDRRGALATLAGKDNSTPGADIDYGAAAAKFGELAKTNPGGLRGIPGVMTTFGQTSKGYVDGSFDSEHGWRSIHDGVQYVAAMWGAPDSGPCAVMLRASAGRTAVPALICTTDVLLLVTGGTCHVGTYQYRVGDMRLQSPNAPMGSVVAGPGGLQAVMILADRRREPAFSDDGELSKAWAVVLPALLSEVVPAV